MSYMKDVAKILGVEIGEKFKVEVNGTILQKNFFLTDYGLFVTGGAGPMAGILNDLLNGEYKVIKFSEPVLTDEEKEYLSNVIRPWKNKVKTITKYWGTGDCVNEFIQICYIQNGFNYYMSLPQFERGSMYKGIELEKAYTIDELGL